MGFSSDILSRNRIDPMYFDALPDDLKMDLLLSLAQSGLTVNYTQQLNLN